MERLILRAEKDFYLRKHGWLMWTCWGVFGLVMVISIRYLRPFWKIGIWIHIVCGCLIFVLNLIYGLGTIYVMGWSIQISVHGIVGTTTSILVFLVTGLGIAARITQNKLKWKTHKILTVQRVHKVIFLSNCNSIAPTSCLCFRN